MELGMVAGTLLIREVQWFDAGHRAAVHARVSDRLMSTSRRAWYSARRCWWKPVWQLDVAGADNVPADGPVLLCGNHTSHLDAAAILAALPRDLALRTSTAAARDVFRDHAARQF